MLVGTLGLVLSEGVTVTGLFIMFTIMTFVLGIGIGGEYFFLLKSKNNFFFKKRYPVAAAAAAEKAE